MTTANRDPSQTNPEPADPGFDPDALRKRYREERDRRIRPEGTDQYLEVTGKFRHFVDDPYVEPGYTRKPLADEVDVVLIGGGFGGLLAGARLRQAGVENIRVVEKGGDFGGTWYWNRYPGVCCDIESYVYMPLLEELAYIPKEKYSRGPEILAHCQAIAEKYDLYRDACFQTEVTELLWDGDDSRWVVSTNRGDAMRARFVCLANGFLQRPKLPGIPGVELFKGTRSGCLGSGFHRGRLQQHRAKQDDNEHTSGRGRKVTSWKSQCEMHVGSFLDQGWRCTSCSNREITSRIRGSAATSRKLDRAGHVS